jgi:hypothetical protein
MEDVLAMLGETGINVVEAAEAEPDEDISARNPKRRKAQPARLSKCSAPHQPM